ncbi:glycosyltransferase family 2 protein [Corynebacterium phoceense]|uniref:glycosyltransferase family 2 protein n=1 Tax=Corynebacterium phoceense TaxID=1686286 RepID=UPI0035252EC5
MKHAHAGSQRPLGVVTVTFSPGDYLAACLDSLPAATAADAVVVLADNGSTDGVPQAAAAQRPNVELLDTGGNIGYGGGMNAGAARLRELAAEGVIRDDFFLITNPDVTFGDGSLDALIACAEAWPRAAAVGPRIVEPDGTNYPSARAIPTLATGIGHALFGTVWPSNPWSKAYRNDADMTHQRITGWLSGSCVLVRWDAFEAIGGFDERYFMYLEDVDLGDRFTRAGWENVFCPEAIITHAKGHSTQAHAGAMLRAHHDSAYRFQADRHPAWWQTPVRWALKIGLRLRACYAVATARKS